MDDGENIEQMKRCVRINRDCADVCILTSRLMARHSEHGKHLMKECIELCENAQQNAKSISMNIAKNVQRLVVNVLKNVARWQHNIYKAGIVSALFFVFRKLNFATIKIIEFGY